MKIRSLLLAGMMCFAVGCSDDDDNNNNDDRVIPEGTTVFNISAPSAPDDYTINNELDPSITLRRGATYLFNVSAENHPFYIMRAQGRDLANVYEDGVEGNGMQEGILTFTVPEDAPDTLFYHCSSHDDMGGVITITN